MPSAEDIVLGLLISAAIVAFYRYVIYPAYSRWLLHRWLATPKLRKAHNMIAELYGSIDGASLAIRDREAQGLHEFTFIYGEMPFYTFAAILETCELAPGGVFMDLGSGTGKVVCAAAMLHDFERCVGIELLPSLYQCSCEVQQRLQDERVQFVQQDYFEADISQATVVYLNATGLFDDQWLLMQEKLLQLPDNALVILTSKKLPAPFTLIDARQRVMSWGMNRVFIYRKS
jgi:hypothetical protein